MEGLLSGTGNRLARRAASWTVLLLACRVGTGDAQEDVPAPVTGTDALRVFLDCASPGCDRDHFRREISFVHWVREPQDAQVHVIMTSETAGGGGRRYVMDFMGREALEGLDDRFAHVSSVTDVQEETRRALTHTLRLGLVRFTALAGFGDDLDVRPIPGEGAPRAAEPDPAEAPEEDPWDFWVFGVGLTGNGFREDQASSRSLGVTLSADRTTEAWKLQMDGRASFSKSEFQLTDSTVFEDKRNDWSVSLAAVRSLGEHWGLGGEVEGSNSVRLNRELLVGLGTGLEWNYFPYSESTRRSLLARYVVNVEHVAYEATTIFGKDDDLLVRQETGVTYAAREPWGNANLGVSATHILTEPDFYSVDFGGSMDYRILRGFSIRFSINHSIIHDQIYLSGEGLSDEERLLRRRQLETDSRTFYALGLTFRFGSIFNNAVNTRFRTGVR